MFRTLGDVVGDLLDAHAEPAAPRLAKLAQLIDNRGRTVGGHCEADADRAAGRRNDRGVDADHFAIEVEQRAAGIAAVNGGVGLYVIVIRPRIDIAVARRDDAGGHRAAQAERIADRDDPFAQPQLVGIAKLHRLERLAVMHAKQSEIALRILADEVRLQLGAVIENNADLVGVGDDVIVGHHEAGRINDESGSQRVDPARRLIGIITAPATLAAAILEKLIEELFHRRTGRQIGHVGEVRIDLLRGRDIDDGIDYLFGDIGDAVRSAGQGGP